MSKRLFDYDPLTNTTQWFHYDPETRTSTIETVQDVEPYINYARELQNDPEYSKQGMKDEFWHVARIPNTIIEKWMVEDGIDVFNKDHWKKVKQKLNSPDWRYLRTSLGRV